MFLIFAGEDPGKKVGDIIYNALQARTECINSVGMCRGEAKHLADVAPGISLSNGESAAILNGLYRSWQTGF